MGTRCNCEYPPGGSTDCPPGNLAICRNENGQCRGYCRPVPISLTNLELENWLLMEVTGVIRPVDQYISFEDRQILFERRFITTNEFGNRLVIRFDFPDKTF